jgi:hypothetical protein
MPQQLTEGAKSAADRERLRRSLERAFPVEGAGSFANLLRAMDEAEQRTRR